jgi:plastocyanin
MNPLTLAAGLLCRAAAATLAAASGAACAADHVVVIDGMAFTPKLVAARPGDTVTWVNKDMFAHNVTAAAAGIKSGELQPGQRWRHTVRQGESFDYLCTLHPVMTGKVQVEEKLRPARRRSTS